MQCNEPPLAQIQLAISARRVRLPHTTTILMRLTDSKTKTSRKAKFGVNVLHGTIKYCANYWFRISKLLIKLGVVQRLADGRTTCRHWKLIVIFSLLRIVYRFWYRHNIQ